MRGEILDKTVTKMPPIGAEAYIKHSLRFRIRRPSTKWRIRRYRDQDHNIYDESKAIRTDKDSTRQRPAPAARPAQPPKTRSPETRHSIQYQKEPPSMEDYWISKHSGNEKNEDGTQKNTMENMWSTFDEEIKTQIWKR